MLSGSGGPAEPEKLKLTELAEAAFERAVSSGEDKDVSAAVRAIYTAAQSTVELKGAHQDPVVLAFLIELGGRLRKIEDRVGIILEPPARGPAG